MISAMPQSLSFVVIHVIFSTKERRPFLDPVTRPKLHAYLATVARNAGCEAYRVGGVADHVHLAIRLSRTLTIADLVETLKTSSSKWVKTQSPDLAAFSWQRGYGCFSVGPGWDGDGPLALNLPRNRNPPAALGRATSDRGGTGRGGGAVAAPPLRG
jgi:REP element-mobilizing transposase RayT